MHKIKVLKKEPLMRNDIFMYDLTDEDIIKISGMKGVKQSRYNPDELFGNWEHNYFFVNKKRKTLEIYDEEVILPLLQQKNIIPKERKLKFDPKMLKDFKPLTPEFAIKGVHTSGNKLTITHSGDIFKYPARFELRQITVKL